MKRRDLIKRINEMAKQDNVEWGLLRQGSNHEVWSYGGFRVVIPRHNEINELTAAGILQAIEEA